VRRANRKKLSLELGCWLFSVARSALDYRALRPAQNAALLAFILKVVDKYPDWGYRLAHGYALERGWRVNRKRFHRLWKQARLQQPLRPPRRKIVTGERLQPAALIRNHVWCYDFVHDRDAADRMIRCLTVKDEATAFALAIEPGYRFSAKDVREVLERLFDEYGVPAYIRSDRGGRVHRQRTARLADRARRAVGLQRSRQAVAQRLEREFQRHVPARLPESLRVRNHGRGKGDHREMAADL
jgi:hypothetical protein